MAKDNQSTNREIARLQYQLKLMNEQLIQVTSSRGYRIARLIGDAKNELKRSPKGFARKVATKLIKRSMGKSLQTLNRRRSIHNDLKTQYQQWILFNEPDLVELEEQRHESDRFNAKPLISIITPVFNPPAKVFRELIDSVLAQTYPNFELCLQNFGNEGEIEEIIAEYARVDDRVRHLPPATNQGIAENSNTILGAAKGDYIALLDHDDTLSPDALYECVRCINNTDADFLFSDKDMIDEEGKRFGPFFKPGWSPEIMLNANYLTHLNVMRVSVMKEVGGWSSETDGAQDWDLFLKIIAHTDKIQHIPKVLYHWRIIATSTAMSIDTKPYALKGQRVAVDKYLKTKGIKAEPYHVGAELLLKWPKVKKVELVILASSQTQTTQFIAEASAFLKASEAQVSCHILTTTPIKVPEGIDLIEVKNGQYINHLQQLAKASTTEFICLLSDRVSLEGFSVDSLANISGWLSIPGVTMAFPRLLYRDSAFALDCGAIVSGGAIHQLYAEAPAYTQGPGGNVEWVKDVSVGSSLFAAITGKHLLKLLSSVSEGVPAIRPELLIIEMYLHNYLSGSRNVFNPKVTLNLTRTAYFNVSDCYEEASELFKSLLPSADEYYNPNIAPDDPMAIIPVRQQAGTEVGSLAPASEYSLEALVHSAHYAIDDNEIEANKQHLLAVTRQPLEKSQPSFLIILPGFTAIYAGLNNIFSFGERVSKAGSKVVLALMVEESQLKVHRELVAEKFPELAAKTEFVSVSMATARDLPFTDIAICTQWATAYILLGYNKCNRKCYFIQDKEASFYPKGSISALVDNTYKFGYYALANTPGLLEWYRSEYGGEGVTIKSKVDLSVWFPPDKPNITTSRPYKVFFYARPNEPRNAFELGAEALRLLKQKYGNDIEIYAAGAAWSPEAYGLEDVMVSLGKISYDRVPAFYRSMDAGLMFMFSGHPGVTASELMASGCPVVVNRYDDETWEELYQHELNALVSLPTAKAVFENLDRILVDSKLREKLIINAKATVHEFYKGYAESCDQAVERLRQKLN